MGKKFRMTAIALVLLLQSILSPLSVIYAEGAKGIVLNDVQLEDADGNILDAELYPERVIQKDSIFRVKYNWALASTREHEESYMFKLPENLLAVSEQGELLTSDHVAAGSYQIGEDGTVQLTFDAVKPQAPEEAPAGEEVDPPGTTPDNEPDNGVDAEEPSKEGASPEEQPVDDDEKSNPAETPATQPENEANPGGQNAGEADLHTDTDQADPTRQEQKEDKGKVRVLSATETDQTEGSTDDQAPIEDQASAGDLSSTDDLTTEPSSSGSEPDKDQSEAAGEQPSSEQPSHENAAGSEEQPAGDNGSSPPSGNEQSEEQEDAPTGDIDSDEGGVTIPEHPVEVLHGTLEIEVRLTDEAAEQVAEEQAAAEFIFQLTHHAKKIVIPVANDKLKLDKLAGMIEESLLTSVILRDANGNIIDADANPGNRPKRGDALTVEYEWKLENGHGYKAGDQFIFQLPEAFELYNEFDGPLSQYGTYEVSMDGTVVFTFNSLIEVNSNVSGTFKAETKFSEQTIVGSTKQVLEFPLKDGLKKVPIHFQTDIGSEIDKSGLPNKPLNPDQIHWSIAFNKGERSIENAILSEQLPAGLELAAGTVKLYGLTMNLDGTSQKGDLIDEDEYEVVPMPDGSFEIRFKHPISGAYIAEFTTNITDEDQTEFQNKATLKGDGVSDLNTTATVEVGYGKALDKAALVYSATDQTILWSIKYNYNEKLIVKDKAVLTDVFDGSQELVDGSFKLYPITFDRDGKPVRGTEVPGDRYTLDSSAPGGFSFRFHDDVTTAYELVYQTAIQDRVYDDGTVNNTASWDGMDVTTGQPIGQVVLNKRNVSTDYAAKTTNWEIRLNGNHFPMENPVITDSFVNSRLEFLPGSLIITNEAGNPLRLDTDYTLEPVNSYTEGFVIRFLGTFTESYTIRYTTQFDPTVGDAHRYVNKAQLDWVEDGAHMPGKESQAIFEPDTYTKANGFKNGSYNAQTKEITWIIGLNYNKQFIGAPVIQDYYTGEQKMVAGSLKVYELELTGSTDGVVVKNEVDNSDGSVYQVDYNRVDGNGNQGFEFKFNSSITAAYQIEYRTSLSDQIIVDEYHNKAALLDGTTQLTELNASVTVKHGKEYVAKEGVQKGKAVHWKVDINRGQSKVSNVEITDKLTPNQILVENSFKLYQGEVEVDGDVRKGSRLLAKGTDYDLDITTGADGSQSFRLNFKQDIEVPYVLEYQSFINAANGATVGNSVSFKGDHIQEVIKESKQNIVVRFSAGSGSATGEIGNLEITKVDAADNSKVLDGAVFTLYDSTGTIAIRTATTGADGKIVFANLVYDNYVLREDTAPEGYVVGIQDKQTVKLDAPVSPFMIQNKKIIRDVELIKTGEDTHNTGLPGAVFKLQFDAQDGSGYQDVPGKTNLVTDADGKILVQELDPGAYQFIEVTAPQDYLLNTRPITFTIGEKQTEVRRLAPFVNELTPGAVELTKLDQDNRTVALSGAVFNLLNAAKNQTLRSNLTTDASGKLLVEGLKPGTYYLQETQAPQGYLVNAEPIEVVIDRGQTAPKQIAFTNALIRNALELTKADEFDNARLAGAEFELQHRNGTPVTQDQKGKTLPATFITNNNGTFLINDLPNGDYQLVETKAPQHYVRLSAPIEFSITAGTGIVAAPVAQNKLIPGSVELIKEDFYIGNIKLENAEFELQYDNGSPVPGVPVPLTTDSDGKIRVDNLRPGNYQFVEKVAPEHYSLDATPRKFTIVKSQAVALGLSVKNKLKEGSFELTKVDAAYADIKLDGAVFRLEDAAGNTVRSNLQTADGGKLTINTLQPGHYKLIETKAPFGYKLDSTPIAFEIEKSQTVTVQRTKSNVIQPGDVEMVKVDDQDGSIKLEDAKFKLERMDHVTKDWALQQDNLVTNDEGKITVTNLRPGDYRFVETEAPQYYKLLNQPVEFKIDLGQQQIKTVEIKNTLIPGNLELTKEDSADSTRKLPGAAFKIVDNQNREVATNLVTGANGIAISGNLQPGSYYLIETQPPAGYAPNSTPIPFTIDKGTTETVRKQLTVKNEWADGAVELTKVDSDNPGQVLAGAEFNLIDEAGNIIRTGLTTDQYGKLQASGLKAGSYSLVETKAPFGYKPDASPVTFTVTRFKTAAETVQKSNEVLRGAVKLTKVETGNTSEKLEGALFKLADEQGTLVQGNLASDANGELTVTDLKPGKYQFVETAAPAGYQLDATPVQFEIVLGHTGVVLVQKENILTPGSVELTKVDADNNSIVLEDAEFELRDAQNNVLQSGLTTNANGKLVVNNLPPGSYSFVETKAPADYVLSNQPIPFTIVKNQQAIAKVTAQNELINGAVEFTKVDAQDNTLLLPDAEFKLLSASGTELLTGLTTNISGKLVINNLKPGTYQLVETKAPADYKLDVRPVGFTIERNQQAMKQIQIENELLRGSVELTKKDANDLSKVLQGAEFELQDAAGHLVKDGLVTNTDGKISVEELLPGNYQFVETKAPFGYELDATPQPFTIVKSQTGKLELVMTNEPVPGSVALTKVDADNLVLKLEGAEFELQDALGNVLEASLTTDADGEIVVTGLKPGFYQFVEKKAPKYYELNPSQRVFEIELGQSTRLELQAANQLIKGSVKLTKVEKGQDAITLEGAVFKLLAADNTVVQDNLTTDENGELVVVNLKPGTYQFVETKAPEHYELDSTPIGFTIVKNETAGTVIDVKAENELIRGGVELVKTDADAAGQVIAGAVFELRNATGQVIQSGLTTDSEGKITVGNLLPGSYRFVETAAAPGYRLDTAPVIFTIDRGPTQTVQVTKQNERLTGAAELTKVDAVDHSITLQGATFELRSQNGQVLRTGLTTNSEGKLLIPALKPGVYSLVETAAPEHYNRSTQPLVFTIAFNPQQVVELTMENTLIKGGVELTKVDSENAVRVLQGAEFKLLDAQGGLLQGGLATTASGKLFIGDLAPGSYQLIETKAPEHYELNAAPINFEIVKSQPEVLKLVFANTLTPGAVQLIKVDEDHPNELLAGAVFTLADAQGTELQTGLTTGQDGKILVENLQPGGYQFIETTAPFGYLLLTAPIPFTIVEGQQRTLELQVSNKQKPGTVELTKVDAGDSNLVLEGAEFSLKDMNGNAIHTGLVTDANGKLIVDGLKPGNYQLVETAAPTGYLLDTTPVVFEIVLGQSAAVAVHKTNTLKPGSVELTKVDADDNSIVLPGAEFELRDANGITLQNNLITDADGKLVVNNLPPGNYSFVETKAPVDYVLSNLEIPFAIVKNQQSAAKVTAENELINGALEISKIDAQDHTLTLPGAEFKLLSADGTELQTGLTTNSSGKLVINNLKPGTYQLAETKAPANYKLNTKPVSFTIVRNQQTIEQVQITNELLRGSAELVKLDADDSSVTLQGAEFELQDAAGRTLLTDLVTDADGKITAGNLLPGNYQFVETKAPFGYELDATPQPFTIVKSQAGVLKLTMTNEPLPGSAVLTKVDADNTSLKLEGAEFDLADATGHVLISNLTTDGNGEITVAGLKPGFYRFIEKKAPKYYQLNAAPITFEIKLGENTPVELEAVNQLIKGSVKLTKVEKGQDAITLEGAVFKLLAADSTVVQNNLATDENGELVVTNLKPGTYQFVETRAPEHYELDSTPIGFTIVKNETAGTVVDVKAENGLIRGDVQLVKTDADAAGQVIAGAEFELRDAQGQVVQSGLKTDREGKIAVGNLLPGNYRFVETTAAPGYRLDTAPVTFTIDRGSNQTVQVTKQNERLTGAAELTKVDAVDHSITLQGAIFELRSQSGQVLRTGLTTNSEGKLLIPALKPGVYSLVETAAPEHYSRSAQPLVFTIAFNPQQVVELTMENTLIKGAVELTKVDSETAVRVLLGAEFKLLDAQGGLLQDELTTDADGKLFIGDLVPGSYQLIETKAPEHYELNAAPINFEIVKSQPEVLKLVFANTLTPGAVQLVKVDEDYPNELLAGAVFTLADTQGNELQTGLTTGQDGKLLIENLQPGSYLFIETKAPEGYQLKNSPVPFTITEGQQKTLEIEVSNQQKTGSVQLIKVDTDNHNRTLKGAEFSLKDMSGNVIHAGLVTDQDGKLAVHGLKPGNYQFVETKAPAGYSLDRTPIEFTIHFNQADTLELTVTNKLSTYYPSEPNPPGPGNPESPENPGQGENPDQGQKPPGPDKPVTEHPGQKPGDKPDNPDESGDGGTTPENPDSPDKPDSGHPGKPDNGAGNPSVKPDGKGGKDGGKQPGDSEAGDSGNNPHGTEESGNGLNGTDHSRGGTGGSEHSGAGTNGTDPGKAKPLGSGKELPRTGEEASYTNVIMGLLAIAAGSWLLFNKRSRLRRADK